MFGEGAALSECLVWLQSLKFKALEAEKKGGGQHNHAIQLLDYVEDFINESELLPHSTRIKQVTSSAVEFVDGNGFPMPVEDLSDGYRSILSMTFELIRQLVATYGVKKVFADSNPTRISVPGVVLVDEIDAHLHPTWQRRIGLWFREHFPQIQFVVTTHSPLICQAAVVGSVFRLPKPGTDQQGEMIEGTALDRLLYGNVLDAYGTEEFGPDVGRSEVGKKFLARLALLNQKELDGTLRQRERVERNHLRAMLPTNAHILAQNER